MKLLDLGCGTGLVAEAYRRAGFHVTGVDIACQSRYRGHEFHVGDMLGWPLENYDFIHVSPPCQRWSKMTRCRPGLKARYPDLITPMRPRLISSGIPYVIENVEDAPLINPVMLCSYSFGYDLYRHRLWECGNGFSIKPVAHREHDKPASKAGHWHPGTVMSIAGHVAPIDLARKLMGVDWYVPRESLVEGVPVYMTEYVGHAAAEMIGHRKTGHEPGLTTITVLRSITRNRRVSPPASVSAVTHAASRTRSDSTG